MAVVLIGFALHSSTTVIHAPCQWEKGGSRSRKSCNYSDWNCWGFCFCGAGGWKRSEGVTWERQSDWIYLIIFLRHLPWTYQGTISTIFACLRSSTTPHLFYYRAFAFISALAPIQLQSGSIMSSTLSLHLPPKTAESRKKSTSRSNSSCLEQG